MGSGTPEERNAPHGAIRRADVWELDVCPVIQVGHSDKSCLC